MLPLIERNSDDWTLYYMAGQCFRILNNIPEAVRLLTKSASFNPNEAGVFLALGIALQIADEYELALERLKHAVHLDPLLISAYNSIGLTYYKMCQFREALEWYSKAEEVIVNAVYDEVIKEKERCFKDEIIDGKKILVVLPYLADKTNEMLRSDPVYATICNRIEACQRELGDMD